MHGRDIHERNEREYDVKTEKKKINRQKVTFLVIRMYVHVLSLL